MSALLSAAAAVAPVAAGWSVHSVCLRRRLERARRDPLTGLPTRAEFECRAARLLEQRACAVVVVDLDGFKAVNDTFGHAAGDAALRAAGERLATWSDTLRGCAARLGGDEFAATVPMPGHLPNALFALHRSLCAPVTFEGCTLPLGASVGALPVAELLMTDLSAALRRADEAMYAAKQGGGGTCLASGAAPLMPTVNGRRDGRNGSSPVGGERS